MKRASGKMVEMTLVVLLCVLLLFALYYFLVMPKQENVARLEQSNRSIVQDTEMIKQQITTLQQGMASNASTNNEFEIRKLLPVQRDVDKLLLNIEEIEYVTDTRIDNISFNNYDATVASSQLQDPSKPEDVAGEVETQTTSTVNLDGTVTEQVTTTVTNPDGTVTEETTTSTINTADGTVTQAEPPTSSIDTQALPNNLKLLTFQISILAPKKDELIEFVKEVEKLERIVHIDEIAYSLPGEEDTFSEDPVDFVTVDLLITTFYYE